MFKLKIDTNNAAFQDADGDHTIPEIIRILNETIKKLEDGNNSESILYDFNGNPVGTYSLTRS